MTYYVNGVPAARTTAASGVSDLDGRWAIASNLDPGPDLLLFNENFGDGGNYTHQLYLSAWAFVDRVMTAPELAALGGPKAGGIFAGTPILLSLTNHAGSVTLNWSGGKGPFQVERTASLLSTWQNATTQSYLRSFTEAFSGGSAFYRVAGN